MRQKLVREVTHTKVKSARMIIENGTPVAKELPDEILIGNVNEEKAGKLLSKKHGFSVTVFSLEPNTKKYEMPLEEFIKLAQEVINPEEPKESSKNQA